MREYEDGKYVLRVGIYTDFGRCYEHTRQSETGIHKDVGVAFPEQTMPLIGF